MLILGPSGSGKSTLVASLIGLVPHSTYAWVSGDLQVHGLSALNHGPGDMARSTGVVFQDPDSQLTMLNVEDEIAFGLENLGVDPADMPARIKQALAGVGLTDQHQTAVEHLSGGMKQRLVIAALLAMQPDILVLDEPTSQLDPVGARHLVGLLQTLCEQRPQMTLILVEHRLDAILPLVQRVLALDQHGRLTLDAPAHTAFGARAAELAAMNVWLPTETEASLAHARDQFDSWCATRPRTLGHRASPVLALRGVSFGHPSANTLLRDVNLTLNRGDICALVGSNGSGKTTLAHLCAGLLKPQTGTILLSGKPVRELTAGELARSLGFVFQNPEHQFVTDRVLDEVRYNRDHLTDESDEDAWQVLRALRLDNLADRNPFTLSHGQKRRLSAATMLVSPRDLIILDEPTFGQDPSAQTELRGLLETMAASGTAILIITHDMDLVWRTADRVIGLHDGQLTGDQHPAEFFARQDLLTRIDLEPPALTRHKPDWVTC